VATEEKHKGFTVVDRRGEADEPKPADPEAPPADEPAAEARSKSLPEIDFGTFVMSLASSALVHLGELSAPGEPADRNLPLAKQTVDILGMLAEKTRGNLSSDEENLVQHLLYDLRLKYVEAKKRG
jgi:hypothetical protein